MLSTSVPLRSEINPEDSWNVSTLYPSFKKWEEAFNRLTESKTPPFWPSIPAQRGKLKDGPQSVKETLDLLFKTGRELEKLYTYAHLRHDEEVTLTESKEAYEKISTLLHAFSQEVSWFEPELLSLPQEVIDSYLKSPLLASYHFHLEKIIHLKPHTLTADKEELLAQASKALSSSAKTFSSLNNADIRFGTVSDGNGKEHPLSHGLYQLYLRSSDRVLRENAFNKMLGTYLGYENTLCELIHGQVEGHLFEANARHYSSCLEAALYPKNIPTSVYYSLIEAARKGVHSLHKYVRLRKKLLKLDKLHLYDMYVPLIQDVEMSMDYPQAEEVVIESVAPLGSEYQNLLKKGLENERWVDRYENKNKRSGAYSSGCYDSQPYILMNYRGILRDVFTLAHEAGHSMHSLLSNQTQTYQDASYPIFVAEVASTFNEELLMHLLVKKADKKEEKAFLINEKIEDLRTTFFRQVMFAEFELRLHEFAEKRIPITPELLKEEFYKLNQVYFGESAVIDDKIMIEWARIPHFYYNFYVYQYATGISASLSLAENVLNKKEGAKEAYLNFLKSGGSRYPIDLLKVAGIDMTTTAPVAATIKVFDRLVTELESLLEG